MSKDQKITKQTLLEDLFNNPKAMEVLEEYNFPCLGCPMAAFEMGVLKLGGVAKAYGIDIELDIADLLDELYDISDSKTIWLDSVDPRYFMRHKEAFIKYINKGFITNISLTIQSFSLDLLKDMKRVVDYDISEFISIPLSFKNCFGKI